MRCEVTTAFTALLKCSADEAVDVESFVVLRMYLLSVERRMSAKSFSTLH